MTKATKKNIQDLLKYAAELKSRPKFTYYSFEELELDEYDFSMTSFKNCRFHGCSFKKAKFLKASLDKCSIKYCNFTGAVFDYARMSNVLLEDVIFDEIKMFSGNMTSVRFSNVSISSSTFVGTDIIKPNVCGLKGIRTNESWINEHCETNQNGIICYLIVPGWDYHRWNHKKAGDSIVSTEINTDIFDAHHGDIEVYSSLRVVVHYLNDLFRIDWPDVWKCEIPWKKAMDIVIPLASDGKFRTGFLTFVEKLNTLKIE